MANNNQMVGVPFANVAGYVFNVNSLIAIDLTEYTSDHNSVEGRGSAYDKRVITLHLLANVTHTFNAERADEMMDWYLEISGQRKVQPVRFPPR